MLFMLPYADKICAPKDIILNLDIDQSLAMHHVLRTGNIYGWEREVFASLLALLSGCEHPKFLDIGSNIGFYALSAKLLFGEQIDVTAIEPTPRLVNIMKHLANLNGVEINIIPCALTGDSASQIPFYLRKNDSCSSSLQTATAIEVIQVPAQTFTSVYANENVIKIDTEGSEYEILEPAIEIFERCSTSLLIEILTEKSFSLIVSLFKNIGYSIYHLRNDFNIDEAAAYRDTGQYNYLLSASELSDNFLRLHCQWRAAIEKTSKFISEDFFNKAIKKSPSRKYILEYFKYKIKNRPDFIAFPITHENWFAFYSITLPRLIHYEYMIKMNIIAICLHFETANHKFNKNIRDLIYSDIGNALSGYPILSTSYGNIYSVEINLPFVESYAHFDFYASLMDEFIFLTRPSLLKRYSEMINYQS